MPLRLEKGGMPHGRFDPGVARAASQHSAQIESVAVVQAQFQNPSPVKRNRLQPEQKWLLIASMRPMPPFNLLLR